MDIASALSKVKAANAADIVSLVEKLAVVSPAVLTATDEAIVYLDTLCKTDSILGKLASKLVPDFIETRLDSFHVAVQFVIAGLAEGPEALKKIIDAFRAIHLVAATVNPQ